LGRSRKIVPRPARGSGVGAPACGCAVLLGGSPLGGWPVDLLVAVHCRLSSLIGETPRYRNRAGLRWQPRMTIGDSTLRRSIVQAAHNTALLGGPMPSRGARPSRADAGSLAVGGDCLRCASRLQMTAASPHPSQRRRHAEPLQSLHGRALDRAGWRRGMKVNLPSSPSSGWARAVDLNPRENGPFGLPENAPNITSNGQQTLLQPVFSGLLGRETLRPAGAVRSAPVPPHGAVPFTGTLRPRNAGHAPLNGLRARVGMPLQVLVQTPLMTKPTRYTEQQLHTTALMCCPQESGANTGLAGRQRVALRAFCRSPHRAVCLVKDTTLLGFVPWICRGREGTN